MMHMSSAPVYLSKYKNAAENATTQNLTIPTKREKKLIDEKVEHVNP